MDRHRLLQHHPSIAERSSAKIQKIRFEFWIFKVCELCARGLLPVFSKMSRHVAGMHAFFSPSGVGVEVLQAARASTLSPIPVEPLCSRPTCFHKEVLMTINTVGPIYKLYHGSTLGTHCWVRVPVASNNFVCFCSLGFAHYLVRN